MKLAEVLSGPEQWMQMNPQRRTRTTAATATCLFASLLRLDLPFGADLIREQNRLLSLTECADLQAGYRWNDDPARTWDEVALVVDDYDRDRTLNP